MGKERLTRPHSCPLRAEGPSDFSGGDSEVEFYDLHAVTACPESGMAPGDPLRQTALVWMHKHGCLFKAGLIPFFTEVSMQSWSL